MFERLPTEKETLASGAGEITLGTASFVKHNNAESGISQNNERWHILDCLRSADWAAGLSISSCK